MDYEKLYKEALERAKSKIKNNKDHVLYEDDIIEMFQELKESKDEKIRKELIEYFKHYSGGDNVSIKFQEWIAWLEKQGEQKPAWSEEDEEELEIIIDFLNNPSTAELCPTLRGNTIDWLKSLKERVQPRSKYEWKQENTDALTDFENLMMHIGISFFGQHAGLDPNDTNAIKEQANILLGLVSKQEWSEEDDKMLIDAIGAVGAADYYTYDDKQEIENWLKSLKDKVQPQNLTITDEELAQAKKEAYNDALDKIEYHSGVPSFDDGWSAAIWYLKKRDIFKPQLQWKPSEEHIRYLRAVVNDVHNIGSESCCIALRDLLEQLKKL